MTTKGRKHLHEVTLQHGGSLCVCVCECVLVHVLRASPAAGVFPTLLSVLVPPLQDSGHVLWWRPGGRLVAPAPLLGGAAVLQQDVLVR